MQTGIQLDFNRSKILEILIANRAQHIENFNAAIEEWKKEYLAAIRKVLTKTKKIAAPDIDATCLDAISYRLPKPKLFADEYDKAIKMLELSCQDTVFLDETTFDRYVNDNWSWKREFQSVLSNYSPGMKKL